MSNFIRRFALLVFQLGIIAAVLIGAHRILTKALPLSSSEQYASSPNDVEIIYENSNLALNIPSGFSRRMKVETATGIEFLPVDKITCLKKDDKNILIFLVDEQNSVEVPNANLTQLGKKLEETDSSSFVQFKRAIVNLAYVRKIIRENKGSSWNSNYIYTIILDDNNQIALPKDKKDHFLAKLEELSL